ncbi:MAG: amidohydrolase family protein [Cytophagaceae bacterium]|nr:amidohydrolase family protein [Gemmatimonadaceae bacterium]
MTLRTEFHRRTWLLAIAVLMLACTRRDAASDGAPDLVLANVTVIDGLGGAPRAGQTIEVRAGRITALRAAAPDDSSTFDVAGAFVTPGLIDSHVHFDPRNTAAVRASLDSMLRRGVTTIREMACCAPDYAKLTDSPDSARFPRIYTSAFWAGPQFMRDDPRVAGLSGLGEVPWLLAVTDSNDLAGALRGARESGATGIKIYSDLSPDLVRKIATSAHDAGMRAWSHTTVFPMRPSEVAAADIDVVSHAALLVWEGTATLPSHYDGPHPFNPFGPPAPYTSIAPRDPRVLAVLATLKRRGTILDPTVAVIRRSIGTAAWAWTIEVTKAAHEIGIPLTVGTDGIPIFDEIEALVDSVGLTPLEVLRSATSVGAAAIGIESTLGTIEVGKIADLVVYRADPTADIRALRTPAQVIRGGRLVGALR